MNETDQFPAIHPVQFHTVYPHTTTHLTTTCIHMVHIRHIYNYMYVYQPHRNTETHTHKHIQHTYTYTHTYTHTHANITHIHKQTSHTHIHHPFDRLTIIVAHIQQAATGNTLHPVTQRFTTRDRTLLHYSGKQRTPATVEQLLSTQICKLKYIVT